MSDEWRISSESDFPQEDRDHLQKTLIDLGQKIAAMDHRLARAEQVLWGCAAVLVLLLFR